MVIRAADESGPGRGDLAAYGFTNTGALERRALFRSATIHKPLFVAGGGPFRAPVEPVDLYLKQADDDGRTWLRHYTFRDEKPVLLHESGEPHERA